MDDRVIILGARGSVPVSGRRFARYGGATACVAVRMAGTLIVLDAGTGLLGLSDALLSGENNAAVLLTHPHIDHILGLTMCPQIFNPNFRFDIYSARFGGLDAREQLGALLNPPLWPVGPEEFPAETVFHELPKRMELGCVTVDAMPGEHPDGVMLLRLTAGGKKVAYCTDCRLSDRILPDVREFARDCDLLLCDGQYSDEEWPYRSEFGHNTWRQAARFGAECGAAETLVFHHDPFRSDSELDAAAEQLSALHPRCRFAREGEVIAL